MRMNQLTNNAYLVPASNNTYTLPIILNYHKFKILNNDANTKTFAISNPSTLDTEITISFNNAVNSILVFPANVTWKDGVTPAFASNKIYNIYLVSDDGGGTYQGAWMGNW